MIAYPLGLAMWISLTDASVGEQGNFVGLAQYRFLLGSSSYRDVLSHTLMYATASVAIKAVLGTVLAMALLRPFPARRVVYALLLLPLLFPVVMDSITWYFLLSNVNGGLNYILVHSHLIREPYAFLGTGRSAMLSLVAINVWHGTPLFTVLMLGGLQAIPRELVDAARADGAGSLRRFRHILLPILTPTLSLATLLAILGTFGDYAIVHLVTAGGPGGATHIVSSLSFATALRAGNLASGTAIALSVVPVYLAGLLILLRLVLRR